MEEGQAGGGVEVTKGGDVAAAQQRLRMRLGNKQEIECKTQWTYMATVATHRDSRAHVSTTPSGLSYVRVKPLL
jgi:hypothetical protein